MPKRAFVTVSRTRTVESIISCEVAVTDDFPDDAAYQEAWAKSFAAFLPESKWLTQLPHDTLNVLKVEVSNE